MVEEAKWIEVQIDGKKLALLTLKDLKKDYNIKMAYDRTLFMEYIESNRMNPVLETPENSSFNEDDSETNSHLRLFNDLKSNPSDFKHVPRP